MPLHVDSALEQPNDDPARLLSITLAVGVGWFPGQLAWSLPAAVVSAVPLLVLAAVSSPRTR